MRKLRLKSKQILFSVSNLEKKHKIISYSSLLFLSVSAYFLRSENQEVKVQNAILNQKNFNLKQNMVIYNRNYEEFPFPIWQKVKRDSVFIVQYLNPEYVEVFGHHFNYDQYAIIGRNNFQLLPKEIAKQYYKKDSLIAVTGKGKETIQGFIDKKGDSVQIKVVKWRSIKDNKDTLIYSMVREIVNIKKE